MNPDRILVTGFGPFLDHGENPSAILAQNSGLRHEVLEVSFSGVDRFIEELDGNSFDAWIQIGLAAKAKTVLLETTAKNRIGKTPDVLGESHSAGPVDPSKPAQLASTLWGPVLRDSEELKPSVDAGDYLCNYLLYKSLERFPDKMIGFLHIPKPELLQLERQQEILAELIDQISEQS